MYLCCYEPFMKSILLQLYILQKIFIFFLNQMCQGGADCNEEKQLLRRK